MSGHDEVNVCAHGCLARSCGTCERDEEIAALREELAEERACHQLTRDGLQASVDEYNGEVPRLKALVAALTSEWDGLRAALEFYADPESYHAISFVIDQTAGWFAGDFSDDHGYEDYDRAMPGKLAREVTDRMSDVHRVCEPVAGEARDCAWCGDPSSRRVCSELCASALKADST